MAAETLQGNGEGYYYIPYGTLFAGTHTLTTVYSGNGEYATATSVVHTRTALSAGFGDQAEIFLI